MSVAFFIVLDQEDPGFETFVDGKALAHCDTLAEITERLHLKDIHDYLQGDDADMIDMIDMGMDANEYEDGVSDKTQCQWFDPREGIEYFNTLRQFFIDNAATIQSAEAILSDLDEYLAVLNNAKRIGAKWHLQLDF